MELGKVEFAPDYKSSKSKRNDAVIKLLDEWLSYPVVEETPAAIQFRKRITGEIEREHLRLQQLLLNAVKKDRLLTISKNKIENIDEMIQARADVNKAADELISFEKENKLDNSTEFD